MAAHIPTQSIWKHIALQLPLKHIQTKTNIHLIGIHHISRESMRYVREVIMNLKPSIVCLELDKNRFRSVNEKAKGPKERFAIQSVFAETISVSKPIGNEDIMYPLDESELDVNDNLYYSLEMATAIETSREIGSCIKLIDIYSNSLIKIDQDLAPSNFIVDTARRDFKL